MPPYDFSMPTAAPDIYKIIEALARQQQQQEPPLTGQQMGDSATAEGLAQAKQADEQAKAQAQAQAQTQQIQDIAQQLPPQQRRPLNPLEADLSQQMINLKDQYENALAYTRMNFPKENDATKIDAIADSMRRNSHAQADKVREYAKAAGIDLNGIENVGYEEAADNLAKRKIQELAEVLDPRGKYSLSSAQYLDNAYLRAGGQGGMSAREAQRFAMRRAQEYQSDRVAYLRNAFDMYGVDGNYINSTGVELINRLAQEMPSVANVYTQAYQLPTNLQDRTNKIQDDATALANKLAGIDRTGKWNFDISQANNQWQSGENELARQHGITMEGIKHNNTMEEIGLTQSLIAGREKELARLQAQLKSPEKNDVQTTFDNYYTLFRGNGATEQEAMQAAWHYTAIQYLGNGGAGKGNRGGKAGAGNDKEPKETEKQRELRNQYTNLFNNAHNTHSDESIAELENFIHGVEGIDGQRTDGKGVLFSSDKYELMKNQLLALKGFQFKLKGDDNNAFKLFKQVSDPNILEEMYPNEDWRPYFDMKNMPYPKVYTIGGRLAKRRDKK